MRWQRITTNYAGYLAQFYSKQTALTSQSYLTQHAALMRDASGWSDYWSVALGKLGYETNEVVSNAEPLQRAWAREQGLRYAEDDWFFQITTAQIKAFKPEILFVNDYVTYSSDYIRYLKAECPSIRLVLGWCGAPYTDASVFTAWDVVLSSLPELVQTFRAQGHRSEHVNHAFDPRVLERIGESPSNVDFGFIGTITKKNNFHNSREQLLLHLLTNTSLEVWLDTHQLSWQTRSGVLLRQWAFDATDVAKRAGVSDRLLKTLPITGKATGWLERPSLPPQVDRRIASRAKTPLFGLDMFRQLQRTRISLNTHIDLSATHASNMRLYEATGVGSCLLTDSKSNLRELFEPDSELVTYASWEECVEKVNYLLNHEDNRRSIARAGQQRTLRDHTFDCRAAQLDEIIRGELA